MDYNKLMAALEKEFTVFKTESDVLLWLSRNNIKIIPSNYSNVINYGNEFIEKVTKKTLDNLQIKLLASAIKADNIFGVVKNVSSGVGLKAVIGGGAGLLIASIFAIAPIPLMIGGAILGYFGGTRVLERKVISTLLENASQVAADISSKLKNVIIQLQTEEQKDRLLLEQKNTNRQRSANYYDSYVPNESDCYSDASSDSPASTNYHLTYKQQQIKDFLERRGIKKLVHFTDKKNLNSILSHGILSVDRLKTLNFRYKYNDDMRLDNKTDYISISISRVNEKLLRSYYNKGTLKDAVVIEIDPAILYLEIDNPRYYCITNAATSGCEMGSDFGSLEGMFAEEVVYSTSYETRRIVRKYQSLDETTDAQAEILFYGSIDPKYITGYKEL